MIQALELSMDELEIVSGGAAASVTSINLVKIDTPKGTLVVETGNASGYPVSTAIWYPK